MLIYSVFLFKKPKVHICSFDQLKIILQSPKISQILRYAIPFYKKLSKINFSILLRYISKYLQKGCI